MENKKSTNQELENLLRKGLEQVNQTPDSDVWEKIATRQEPQNVWLRLRNRLRYVVPIVVVIGLVIAGWWYYDQASQTLPTDAPQHLLPEVSPAVPVAAAESGDLAPAETTGNASSNRAAGLLRLNTVPAAAVHFQAETGVQYQSPTTGTTVHIPGGALVDSRGRAVRGEVELMLREYRDIPDFLASGIPMHYGDERGEFFFNSGGMFEVRVTQNGETLGMAPGQAYDLTFAATGELTDANMFYLDDQTGAWAYLPDPAFSDAAERGRPDAQGERSIPSQARVVSESEAVRNNRQRDCLPPIAEMPIGFDAATWVKTGVRMGHELATGKTKMPPWFRKRPWISNETLLNSLERGAVRIVRSRDQSELFFPEDISGVFTELKAFKDCYFMRSGDSINPQTELRTDVYWDRISISQDIGNRCNIWLYSDKGGLLQFYANLTATVGNKSFDVQRILTEYRRLRTERLENLETAADNLRRFLAVAPAFQNEDEWCIPQPQWLEMFEAQHPQMTQRYEALVQAGLTTNDSLARIAWENWRARVRESYMKGDFRAATTNRESRENLQYALRLTNFGIYNCDQIFRLGQQQDYIYATYETSDGDRIFPATVSILERNTRLFFTLPSASRMLLLPGRSLDVIVTDSDGRFYHIPAVQYAHTLLGKKAQPATFTVKDITDKTRTPRDWANYLDM
ncbi:MAG: hypothetical protein IPM98_12550 [Lewinellaceae bacterium]|nr:hypothetical protein [Lewinellaceae bacterium]